MLTVEYKKEETQKFFKDVCDGDYFILKSTGDLHLKITWESAFNLTQKQRAVLPGYKVVLPCDRDGKLTISQVSTKSFDELEVGSFFKISGEGYKHVFLKTGDDSAFNCSCGFNSLMAGVKTSELEELDLNTTATIKTD